MIASRRWWIALGASASVHIALLTWLSPVVTLRAADVSAALHVRLVGTLRRPEPKAPAPRARTTVPNSPVDSKPAPAPQPAPARVAEPSGAPPGSSLAIPAVTEVADDVVLPIHRVSRLPRLLRAAEPVYPESERAGGREAQVVAEVVVDARGQLLDATIVRSGGAAFDAAVLQALRHSTFEPGYLKDAPVAVRFQVPYRFKLR